VAGLLNMEKVSLVQSILAALEVFHKHYREEMKLRPDGEV